MREDITVDKAILRGQLIVNVPALISMLGLIALSVYLGVNKILPFYIIPVGIGLSFIVAWLVWSFMVTKWRIWAFTKVNNVHELKEKAIRSGLIWADGSFSERTEIRTAHQKAQLLEIEKKFQTKDVYEDDLAVRNETIIYISKVSIVFEGITAIAAMYFGISVVSKGSSLIIYFIGFALFLFGVYLFYSAMKNFINYKPQIIFNDKELFIEGIGKYAWSAVHNEKLIVEGTGKNSKYYLTFHTYELDAETLEDELVFHQFNIENLEISPNEIEDLIRIYRLRNTKKKK